MNLEIPSIRLRHRSWPVITFIGTQWSPRRNKGQKMNKNVKFWHSLKVKPGFLIVLINLKTGATQWRAGVGRQRGTKVREAGERTREAGDSDPPVPPPPSSQPSTKPQSPLVNWTFQGFQLLPSSLSIDYFFSMFINKASCKPKVIVDL